MTYIGQILPCSRANGLHKHDDDRQRLLPCGGVRLLRCTIGEDDRGFTTAESDLLFQSAGALLQRTVQLEATMPQDP